MVIREVWAHLRIADPAIAWLCGRGEMVSAPRAHEQAMGFWLMNSLAAELSLGRRTAYFADELELERRRASAHPAAVSRLAGIYHFDDEQSARRACRVWPGFEEPQLVEVGILEGSRLSRHDAQWISAHLGSGGDPAWMDLYWTGLATEEPVWELLVDGRAVIYGTDLRERSYEVVRQTWPRSVALLNLSRIAVELRSDLGLITPMVHTVGRGLRVDFHMNMVDADDAGFLDRLRAYHGPRNFPPNPELVVPDLRSRGFVLSAAATAGPGGST